MASFNLFTFLFGFIFVVPVWYFGFFHGQHTKRAAPGELAGRAVLLGVVSMMIFSISTLLQRNGMFPEMPNGILTFMGMAVAISLVLQLLANADSERESKVRLVEAQKSAWEHPDSLKFAWNLAAATLENYLDRNLSQVKWIFNIAVIVMLCGFVILGYGVMLAMGGDNHLKSSVAVSVSGLITQFISATFMFIYRSTMAQASSNVVLLERLNGIGMAVQLVDKMSENSAASKDAATKAIIDSLLSVKAVKAMHHKPEPPKTSHVSS